nr:MAG TPA: hypothetical protein [Caudoviricetes sp.]
MKILEAQQWRLEFICGSLQKGLALEMQVLAVNFVSNSPTKIKKDVSRLSMNAEELCRKRRIFILKNILALKSQHFIKTSGKIPMAKKLSLKLVTGFWHESKTTWMKKIAIE